MITKFKIYELMNEISTGEPEIGDYVIINWGYTIDFNDVQKLRDHIENNIGKIIDYGFATYYVKYKNLPRENKIIQISKDYIKHWSKNKEELELILATKKYNL